MTTPLTPADCDLQDFAFMPLDVARLRDSDLSANETPDACWAAVLLWAASWHQVPAASIPNSDTWIAKQAGYAQRGKIAKEWAAVRPGALRGWVLCADGRLYHPVVAEKAVEAWKSKVEQRYRTEVARVKKHNQRHGTTHSTPEFSEWLSLGRPHGHHLSVPGDKPRKDDDSAGDKPSKGQREGQGQGQRDSITGTNVPDGGAVKSPAELTKAELWTAGKSLLAQQGMPNAQCGSFVGKLVKDYGDQVVVEAVRTAVFTQPADAAEFLKAVCQKSVGERASPESFRERDARTGRERWEEMTGEQHPENAKQQTPSTILNVIDVAPAKRIGAPT